MKKAFLSLVAAASWIACFAANATTYPYSVRLGFLVNSGGSTDFVAVTGEITTSCVSCGLTSSNVLSWSLTGSDGSSASSSDPNAGLIFSGINLEATYSGIYTLEFPTVDGKFSFCGEVTNCFNPAGLQYYRSYDAGPQSLPTWVFKWGNSSTVYQSIEFTLSPVFEVASSAIPEAPAWALMIIGFASIGVGVAFRRVTTVRFYSELQ